MKRITIEGKTYTLEQTPYLNPKDKCVAKVNGVWRVLTFVYKDWVWDSNGYAFEEHPYYLRYFKNKIHKIINLNPKKQYA